VGVTSDIAEAAAWPTKKAALESAAHQFGEFIPRKINV
jgi:hypothetical protein